MMAQKNGPKLVTFVINCVVQDGTPLDTFIDLRTMEISGQTVVQLAVLQTGKSWVQFLMMSLEFFIDKILPAQLWLWGRLSL
jgi:hypothetical protein